MYLQKISLENFRCFEKLDIDFHKKLTVIVGENGAGKTSILEAVSIAMSTMFMSLEDAKSLSISKNQARLKTYTLGTSSDVQAQYPVKISAEALIDDGKIRWTRSLNSAKGQTTYGEAKEMISLSDSFQQRLKTGDQSLILPIIAYYGTGRLWDYHREKQRDIFEASNRTSGYLDSVDGTANIKLMMNWFAKMTIQKYQNQESGLGPVPVLDAVYTAMEQCYHHLTDTDDVKMQYNMSTKELDVIYTDKSGRKTRMPVNLLSAGYKSTVSLAADIAYRMAVLNPQCQGSVCKETDGIILIDEVDLHLHPAWQQVILRDLMSIFPRVQFIVTTHAPEVINSVAREHVIVVEDSRVMPAQAETYGKDANGILRAIMNVNERPDPVMEKIAEFYKAIDTKDYKNAETIIDGLENEIGEDPELVSMRVQLDLEQL